MKRLCLSITFLLSFGGVTTSWAQDEEVVLNVAVDAGEWHDRNNNTGNPYARSWYSTTTPAISICCMQGSNKSTDIRGKVITTSTNNMAP